MEITKKVVIVCILLYILMGIYLYFFQESLIFFPNKLDKNHKFDFKTPFKEGFIAVDDSVKLHTLYFESKEKKGVVVFYHGNSGNCNNWGNSSELAVKSGYDFFLYDYRNFGKSNGEIKAEQDFLNDAQLMYNHIKKQFPENKIIVVGTSLGTGLAAEMAKNNRPKMLILNSPYYSMEQIAKERYWYIPSFVLRYKFRTNKDFNKIKCPVHIFHGSIDTKIPVLHARKLKEENPKINYIEIPNYGHNDMFESHNYKEGIYTILRD